MAFAWLTEMLSVIVAFVVCAFLILMHFIGQLHRIFNTFKVFATVSRSNLITSGAKMKIYLRFISR